MSLPSQTPRATAPSRTHMRSHRRRGPRLPPILVAGIVVAIVAGGAWWLTKDREDNSENPTGPETAAAADRLLEDPFGADGGLQPDEAPQPRTGSLTNRNRQPRQEAVETESRETPPVVIAQGGGEAGFAPSQPITMDEPRSLGESLAQTPASPPAAAPTPTPTPTTTPTTTTTTTPKAGGAFSRAVRAAEHRLAARDPVAARVILNEVLRDPRLSEAERSQVRARLTEINQELVFSATVVAGDPMTETYEIVRGDRLSTLPGKLGLAVDWRLLARINAIPDPNKIRLGQKIKIVRGPFHAVVDKSDYRLDLYAGPPEDEGAWVYIRSFRVGLGEGDSTPTGNFVVKRQSKLINPHWVNPRTGERFDKDDPENPIGERWIGIEGLGADAVKTGYGLHGTIEPESIGQQKSMGCVRLLSSDVELVYEMLVEGISRVRVVD